MKRVRMAVIGAGHLGRIHARLLKSLPEVELLGVVDPDVLARHQAAEEFGVPTYAQAADLCERLDAAIVASTTSTHHALASDLLRRGIHVLVEKPLAGTLAEARELVALATAQQRVLQVGHVERFNPGLVAVLPHLGTPLYIDAVRTSSHAFRSLDIGVVHDLMIHDIDVVLSLMRADPAEVEGLGISVIGPHEDMAHARLRFASGCVVNLQASRTSFVTQRKMNIVTDRSFVSIDFATGSAKVVRPSPAVLRQEIDVQQLTPSQRTHMKENLFRDLLPLEELSGDKTNAILEEQRDFVASIQQGKAPRVTGTQACAALAVCEQIVAQVAVCRTRLENGLAASTLQPPTPTTLPLRRAG